MTLLGLALGALLAAASPEPTAPGGSDGVRPSPPRALSQETRPAPATKRKPKVIRLEELKIEGRIQKPQAFYLLQRSNLNFDDLSRDERFLHKVVESVEKAPF